MQLDCIAFPQKYQYATIDVGQVVTVWSLRVSGRRVAFIDRLSCDWDSGNDYWEFLVDGELTEKIQRKISFTTPDIYNPPIIANRSIEFIFHNMGTVSRTYAVLCDGRLCKQVCRTEEIKH